MEKNTTSQEQLLSTVATLILVVFPPPRNNKSEEGRERVSREIPRKVPKKIQEERFQEKFQEAGKNVVCLLDSSFFASRLLPGNSINKSINPFQYTTILNSCIHSINGNPDVRTPPIF